MEVKGTAIKSISEFVKKNYKDRYYDWLNSLPEESKKIMKDGIYATDWYSMEDAAVIPTQRIGEMFFNNDFNAGAWESGRYSADIGLTGVYKLYVRMSKPGHIIARAGKIFSTYYRPSKIITENETKSSLDLIITEFEQPNAVIENRIGGWIERALEMSGCKSVSVNITKSMASGDDRTIYDMKWE